MQRTTTTTLTNDITQTIGPQNNIFRDSGPGVEKVKSHCFTSYWGMGWGDFQAWPALIRLAVERNKRRENKWTHQHFAIRIPSPSFCPVWNHWGLGTSKRLSSVRLSEARQLVNYNTALAGNAPFQQWQPVLASRKLKQQLVTLQGNPILVFASTFWTVESLDKKTVRDSWLRRPL